MFAYDQHQEEQPTAIRSLCYCLRAYMGWRTVCIFLIPKQQDLRMLFVPCLRIARKTTTMG